MCNVGPFFVFDDDGDFVVDVMDVLGDMLKVVVVGLEAAGESIRRHFTGLQGLACRFGSQEAVLPHDEIVVELMTSEMKIL